MKQSEKASEKRRNHRAGPTWLCSGRKICLDAVRSFSVRKIL
jgi:hypothetical protein